MLEFDLRNIGGSGLYRLSALGFYDINQPKDQIRSKYVAALEEDCETCQKPAILLRTITQHRNGIQQHDSFRKLKSVSVKFQHPLRRPHLLRDTNKGVGLRK